MSDENVGPIIFGDTVAREQLLRGEVISFRSRQRTTGETWARWSRTGEKQADVRVRELTAIDALREGDVIEPLDLYWKLSGFQSPDAWRRAIRKHHDTGEGYLYFVTLDPGEIVARLAGDTFPGDQPIENDIKPSAHRVARVINPARPGEVTDLEPRHVLDVMKASAGRVALHVYDRTDGQHWYRYRPWDDQWETMHAGPGIHGHDVSERSPWHAMDDWVLTDDVYEVRWVRPSETRHWEWRWCTRLVVEADLESGAEPIPDGGSRVTCPRCGQPCEEESGGRNVTINRCQDCQPDLREKAAARVRDWYQHVTRRFRGRSADDRDPATDGGSRLTEIVATFDGVGMNTARKLDAEYSSLRELGRVCYEQDREDAIEEVGSTPFVSTARAADVVDGVRESDHPALDPASNIWRWS